MINFIVFSILVASIGAQGNEGMSSMNMADMNAVTPEECDNAQGWTDAITPAQQEVITKVVGDRNHRMEHALWHASRSGFDENSDSVLKAYGADWINPHPLCPPPSDQISENYNPAGEDFLYMHRIMVGAIRRALISAKLPCIRGWQSIPDPAEWPVPDNNQKNAKSENTLMQLKNWDWYFQSSNPQAVAWRQSISLSQMGFALEFTIHNNLHMRYATQRPLIQFQSADGIDGANIPLDGKFSASWNFDDKNYNWLADPYSAALNPYFWKIHGYVDTLIDRWLRDSRTPFNSIELNCTGILNCYSWLGHWVGNNLNIDPAPTKSLPGGHQRNSQDDLAFKLRRMKLAHLGVLIDPLPNAGSGGPKGPPAHQDPFSEAVNSVCRANSL